MLFFFLQKLMSFLNARKSKRSWRGGEGTATPSVPRESADVHGAQGGGPTSYHAVVTVGPGDAYSQPLCPPWGGQPAGAPDAPLWLRQRLILRHNLLMNMLFPSSFGKF